MIWDFSRLPVHYRRFAHYARGICRFDWDLLRVDRIDVFPLTRELGWARLMHNAEVRPAIGVRVNDPDLRAWGRDYLGRRAPWADKANAFRSKIYIRLGAGEQTLANDLTQCFRLVEGFVIGPSRKKTAALEELFGSADADAWMPAALRAFTPLYVPEISEETAGQFRQVVTSR